MQNKQTFKLLVWLSLLDHKHCLQDLQVYKVELLRMLQMYFLSITMRDIDEAYAEWMEVRRYAPAMTFVRVENGEYPRVHVVKGVSNARQDLRFDIEKSVETSYSIDELPEDLAGKIAVLNILNDEQYAVRVGYKYDNNIFWIERDLNDDTL